MVSNKAISPPVANLLVTCRWPVGLVSANCWLTVGRLLADCWPTVGRLSVEGSCSSQLPLRNIIQSRDLSGRSEKFNNTMAKFVLFLSFPILTEPISALLVGERY